MSENEPNIFMPAPYSDGRRIAEALCKMATNLYPGTTRRQYITGIRDVVKRELAMARSVSR